MKAIVLDSQTGSSVQASITTLSLDKLPKQGNTLVKTLYSSVNYKDGLAVTGKGKIVRAAYPFVPGIDICGEIIETTGTRFRVGDIVVGTGWSIGEAYWGGYSEYQWMQDDWLVKLPSGMSPLESMIMGTAGFTAMLSVLALEKAGLGEGDIVVTGASGGVGSIAVHLLARLGHSVVASTGKTRAHEYLRELGGSTIIDRSDLGAGARRPLDNARWTGAVDSVGGKTLEAVVSQMGRHGSIAACGLAGGYQLETTVYPFILRGVNLLGIDSNTCPRPIREEAWHRLADSVTSEAYNLMHNVISLDDVIAACDDITDGKIQGRLVVNVAES